MNRPAIRARMGVTGSMICKCCRKKGRHMMIEYPIPQTGPDGRVTFEKGGLYLCSGCANEAMNAMIRAITQTDTEKLRIRHDGLDGDV